MRLRILSIVLVVGAISITIRADEANDRFLAGIDQLANGKFDSAAESFDKAIAANSAVASYHLDRGIVMMILERGDQAEQSLARAAKLEPKNPDVRVWAHARLLIFDPMTQGGSPPYTATPYARNLIDAAMADSPHRPLERARAKATIRQIAQDFGWRQLGQMGADASFNRVKAMYEAGQYRQCLAFIDRLRSQSAVEPSILGYNAHCRLALNDFQGAREYYNHALKSFPLTASWIIGRARCEIAMGSLRDAEADLALARLIDPKMADAYTGTSQKELSEAQSKSVKESPAALLASLKQAVAESKSSDEELFAIAGKLMRARMATRYDDSEEYTREYGRLRTAMNTEPQNVDKLVALGKFLIVPTVTRKAAMEGVDAMVQIPCGAPNASEAAPLLAAAAKLAPRDPRVMIQQTLLFHSLSRYKDMLAWANQAISAGVADLDVCVIYLLYYTELADQLTNQAIILRTPTYTSSEHREGNKIVTTTTRHDPTPADLAKAAELDKQSQQLRTLARAPLDDFAAKLKNSNELFSRVRYQLALAHEYRWRGKYELAIKAAQEALALSPYDIDTLNLLIELCPTMQQVELGNQCQDTLNNLINPSPGRTLDKVWPLLRQTNGAAAMEVVERAEKIDPSSVAVAANRFAVADQLGTIEQTIAAGRLVLVMEEARLRLGGRTLDARATGALSAVDAGLSAYIRVHLAQKLEQAGHIDEAVVLYRGAAGSASRVPPGEWTQTLPNTALSTNDRDQGASLKDLATVAWRQCAYKALARRQYDEAAIACGEMVRFGENGQTTFDIGYQVYRALGWKPLAGRVPDNWQGMFQQNGGAMNNGGAGNKGEAFDAEISAIDSRLEKIEREIEHGLGPAELAQLTAERETLKAKRRTILNQRRRP